MINHHVLYSINKKVLGPWIPHLSPASGLDALFGIFIFSSGCHFVNRSRTVCAILEIGSMRNISVKLVKFGPVVQEDMSLKDISIFSSSSHQNSLSNWDRGHYEEHFCAIN